MPFEDNVLALRLLAGLVRLGAEAERTEEQAAIDQALRTLLRPEGIKAQGRMIGGLLIALEETRAARRLVR
jgi:hypothetical protein